jgi:hypothetical protein
VCHANHSHGFIIRDLRVLGERPLGRNCKSGVIANSDCTYVCIAIFQAKRQHRYRRARRGRFTKGADLPGVDPLFGPDTPRVDASAYSVHRTEQRRTPHGLPPGSSPVLMTADLLVVRREADAVWIRYLFFGDDDFEFATRIPPIHVGRQTPAPVSALPPSTLSGA